MGRKGNWFNAVKKALHSESKDKSAHQEEGKSKKKWFRKKKRSGCDPKSSKPTETNPSATPAVPTVVDPKSSKPIEANPSPAPPAVVATVVAATEPVKLGEANKEQPKQAYNATLSQTKSTDVPQLEPPKSSESDKGDTKEGANVGVETPKASEAALSAIEVVRKSITASHIPSKSKEELAAIKIQNAFRGYMARRTLRALRGLVRLKTVMQGQTVKRQTTNALKCMQTLARIQCQIRDRRLKMAQDNQVRQTQIQLNYDKDQAKGLDKSQQDVDGWDSTGKTKKQIEAELQSKHEAAIRRERTMAYAYTHQQPWKATSRPASTLYMDPHNFHWGWSWLERWLAARPWEGATTPDNGFDTRQTTIPTSFTKRPCSANGRLSTSSAPSRPSTPGGRKLRSPSPKASPMMSPRESIWGMNDDTKSMVSMRSEQSRRNSVAGSSVEDDDNESLASSITLPSYMGPTKSAKAKIRSGSKSKTPDRVSVSSAAKRLSYSPSPVRSRHSTSSTPDANSISDALT